jgi:hypothetical protein
MKKNKQQISEDLNRFNSIMGYSVEGKRTLNEAPEDEEEQKSGDEGSPEEGGDEFDFAKETPAAEEGGEDFDFGGEEGSEEGGNEDFDFGGEGSPEEGGEEMEDEFGTASEFSAADDIEMEEEDVEEIDVTAIVNKSEEAKETAELAAQSSQETNTYVKDLMDKFSNLEAQLGKMDSIMAKVSKIEDTNKTPDEKLEMRSLDSFPYSMKLTDYWEDKVADPTNNYEVTGNDEEVFKMTQEDITDYNEDEIKNSFNPGIE